MWRVHRLVAEAFLPNKNQLTEVNHIDGNKKNNKLSNLEWSSRQANMDHARRIGLWSARKGEASSRAILTQEQVDYVRKNCRKRCPKFGQSALGRKFGVSNSCISLIVSGRNW